MNGLCEGISRTDPDIVTRIEFADSNFNFEIIMIEAHDVMSMDRAALLSQRLSLARSFLEA